MTNAINKFINDQIAPTQANRESGELYAAKKEIAAKYLAFLDERGVPETEHQKKLEALLENTDKQIKAAAEKGEKDGGNPSAMVPPKEKSEGWGSFIMEGINMVLGGMLGGAWNLITKIPGIGKYFDSLGDSVASWATGDDASVRAQKTTAAGVAEQVAAVRITQGGSFNHAIGDFIAKGAIYEGALARVQSPDGNAESTGPRMTNQNIIEAAIQARNYAKANAELGSRIPQSTPPVTQNRKQEESRQVGTR